MSENVQHDSSHNPLIVAAAWAAVGIPLLWGVVETLFKASLLFK